MSVDRTVALRLSPLPLAGEGTHTIAVCALEGALR